MGCGASARPPRVKEAAVSCEGCDAKIALLDSELVQSQEEGKSYSKVLRGSSKCTSCGSDISTSEIRLSYNKETPAYQNTRPDSLTVDSLSTLSREAILDDLNEEQCGNSPARSVISSFSHLDVWDRPSETLLLLDWDDTSFPTSALGSVGKQQDPDWWKSSEDFKKYCDTLLDFFRDAAASCTVRIVTMGTQDWLRKCFGMLQVNVPDFDAFLEELDIKVCHCREFMAAGVKAECRDASHYLKTRAMSKVVKDFYNSKSDVADVAQRRKRSWKNILSVGDSPAERFALQDIVFRHQQRSRDGKWKDYRYKTLMLLEQPTLHELTCELRTVKSWLSTLLHHDGDMDIAFDSGTMTLTGKGLPKGEKCDALHGDAVNDTLIAA